MQSVTRKVYVEKINGLSHDMSNLKIVGNYSVNGNSEYCNDISQLKYYKKPSNVKNVHFDLNVNEKNTIYIKEDIRTRNRINFMFNSILDNLDYLWTQDSETKWIDAEFIILRGVVKQLLLAPFQQNEDWIICCVKFRGSIYLCLFDTDELKTAELNKTPEYDRQCMWGYKFEQYLLSDAPDKNPDLSKPLNENEEFYCLFKSVFGNNTLLYACEIDGVCSKEMIKDTVVGKKLEFVELKTVPNRLLRSGIATDSKRTLKWWAQTYLLGVNSIICGSKDYHGIVREIQEVNLQKCSLEDKQEKCKSFCSGFLQLVQEIVCKEYDECVYKFTFDRYKRDITIEEMSPDPESEFTFLKPWYIKKVEEHYAKKNML